MIQVQELEKRIEKLLESFRKKTKCLACVIIDNDGFIISMQCESRLNTIKFERRLVKLISKAELMNKIQFMNQDEKIFFGEADSDQSKGILIYLRSSGGNLTFLSVLPSLLYLEDIEKEIENVTYQISQYFSDSEGNTNGFDSLYKLV